MESRRLGFKIWSQDNKYLALALWGNADVTALIGGPSSSDQVEERLQIEYGNFNFYNVQYWPIFDIHSEAFVGCCGLRPRGNTPNQYELGFHLLPCYWGKGLALEAAERVCLHAFTALGAQSLFAGHHPMNASSQALLGKLGFEFTHTELYLPTGLDHPSYQLSKQKFVEMKGIEDTTVQSAHGALQDILQCKPV